MKTLTLTVGALLVALTTGCSLQPIYQRPDSAVPTAYPAAQGALAAHPSAAATDWRQVLADARLQRLVELGLKNNRDLRVALLNVERVQAQYRLARSALAPQIGVQAGMDAVHTPDGIGGKPAATSRSYSAGLTAAWEFDLFGRLRDQSDAAFQQYLASDHARQAAQILLIAQIADQYLASLAADAQLKLTLDTRSAADASYQLVKLQYDTGTVAELDLRLARTTVDQADANYQAQLRQRAQAENGLVLLVGQALPDDLPAPARLEDSFIMADMPAGLPSELLLRRPDILQAEAELRAEHADIGAARAAFFPSLSLTASPGSQSSALGGLFAAGSGAWTLLPVLTLPIFNAGANEAKLDVAVLSRDIGVAHYQKAVQTAFREVADGLAARGTYGTQLAAQQRETADQQRRLELENLLYKNGVDSYQNVLAAQTALYSAQQSLLTARLNQLTSLVDLYRALGGGWHAQS